MKFRFGLLSYMENVMNREYGRKGRYIEENVYQKESIGDVLEDLKDRLNTYGSLLWIN